MKSSSETDAKRVREQVKAYLAGLNPKAQKHLRALRAAIRSAAPGGTEGISYGILVLRVDGRALVAYAGWKEHSSIYPITSAMKRVLGADIKKYKTSKGTIKFPHSKAIPATLVRRLMKARLAELLAKAGK